MNFTVDHKNGIPLYIQVENILRDLIARPEYQNGRLLPNEEGLSKRLGISRNTVRQAANKLVYEGLIVRKKGVGTRVANNPISTALESWHSFAQEMNSKGIPFKNYEVNVKWEPADEMIAELFVINPGRKVLRLERLRGMDKGPVVYFISYFHPRVGLTGHEDLSQRLYDLLEREYSTVVMVSKEEIKAIKSSDTIAAKLQIPVGDPVLYRKRYVYDPGQRIVEYNLCYYRADSFTYSIEIERNRV